MSDHHFDQKPSPIVGHDDIMYPSAVPFVLVHLARIAAFWTGVTCQALTIGLALYWLRIFAIGAASPGTDGGVRSLMALRQILERGCGALVIPEQVSVPRADQAFDDMDNLKDESAAASLKAMARRLVELASVMG